MFLYLVKKNNHLNNAMKAWLVEKRQGQKDFYACPFFQGIVITAAPTLLSSSWMSSLSASLCAKTYILPITLTLFGGC